MTPGGYRVRLLEAAVLLVALNLRGAIAAVSPVLGRIRSDLGLSAGEAGMLTTGPVLCFALAAPLAAWLGRRYGAERVVLGACLLLAVTVAARPFGGWGLLLAGTVLVGVAMTLGNVMLPVVLKRDFGARAGQVAGLLTAGLAAGAALTAAATAPLAALAGWRTALALGAGPAAVAALVWWAVAVRGRAGSTSAPRRRHGSVWSSGTAWTLALVLGFQSSLYFALTAWLPSLLQDTAGLGPAPSGLAMSLFQLLGIAGTLLVPPVASRWRDQRVLGLLVAGGWLLTLAGLLTWPAAWVAWSLLGGVAQGAGISLAFTLLVLRSADESSAAALSGMTQLVGYGLGALGPVVVGLLQAATGGWTLPLATLLGVALALGWCCTRAGRPVQVRV